MTAQPEMFDDDGRVRAEAGMQTAEHAVDTRWRLAAEVALARLAATGREFDADDLRDIVGPPLGAPSAIGAVFNHASKQKLITHVGWRTSRRPEAHARPLRTWRGVL